MFKIDQLITIGGPSCAGKSFLIKKILQGDCPSLSEQLGVTIPFSWLYVEARQLAHMHQQMIKRLVVHYDFYTQYSQKNGFNHLDELINNSNRTIILTLYVTPKILTQRNNSRIPGVLKSLFNLSVYKGKNLHTRTLRNIIRLFKIRKAYKHDFSEFLYERWFNSFNQSSVTNNLVLYFNNSNIKIVRPYKTDKVGIFTGVK